MGGSDKANGSHPGLALTEKQEKFIRLIAQGVDNSQACRTVGINRRTGTRWRYGRTLTNTAGEPVHYPPVTLPHRPVTVRSCRYLSLEERTTIADLHRHGVSVRSIARDLGRSASTVSRELRRNRDLTGRYLPNTAQRMASGRLLRPRVRRLALDDELAQVVCGLLSKRWSPEQIAHELTRRYPGQRARRVCPESIYQAIYDPDVRLTRPAKTALRTGRRRRRRRVQGRERRGRLVGMTMIDQRPAEVANRVQAGHWEGDSIMGSGNTSSIGTLVERRTRFIMLLHVPTGTRPADPRPRRHHHPDEHAADVAAADVDVGSRQGDGPPRRDRSGHRNGRVLLPGAFSLAARVQRERQRTSTQLLPQAHRPQQLHPGGSAGRR